MKGKGVCVFLSVLLNQTNLIAVLTEEGEMR